MASSRGGRRAERERNETIPLVQQLDSISVSMLSSATRCHYNNIRFCIVLYCISGVSSVEWVVSEAAKYGFILLLL